MGVIPHPPAPGDLHQDSGSGQGATMSTTRLMGSSKVARVVIFWIFLILALMGPPFFPPLSPKWGVTGLKT